MFDEKPAFAVGTDDLKFELQHCTRASLHKTHPSARLSPPSSTDKWLPEALSSPPPVDAGSNVESGHLQFNFKTSLSPHSQTTVKLEIGIISTTYSVLGTGVGQLGSR